MPRLSLGGIAAVLPASIGFLFRRQKADDPLYNRPVVHYTVDNLLYILLMRNWK
jgi:hypothetical protein